MLTRYLKDPFILIPLTIGVVLPCAAFSVWHFGGGQPAPSALILKDAVKISGQPLPVTELLNSAGDRVPSDTLLTGKVLLVFVTTDCKPCRDELKMLSDMEARTGNKIKIFGVGIESQSAISDYISLNNFKTSILHDKDAELMKRLSVRYFPTKFLIQNGIIVKTWFGNSRSESELFQELGL